jgi:alpha-N-arabinofuranosidase
MEYCNGDQGTEFGQLRADHGCPEPFDVTYWEIGNELYGRWQPNWTTPDGNVDRYKRFKRAIHAVDPDVDVFACGEHGEWNDHLIDEAADELRSVTGHDLVGPTVDDDVDRDELYHALMGYTHKIKAAYSDLAERMRAAGVEDPHHAITELQLTVSRTGGSDHSVSPPWRGSRHHERDADLPGKKSIAEAVWDASIIHDSIRSEGEMELITHTGAVNHGGGLQKRKERVWADPCHYGHAMGAALFGKTPIAVEVACDTVSVDASYDQLQVDCEYPVLDAVAAVDETDLAVMVFHRGSGIGDIETRIDFGGAVDSDSAHVTTLAADSMTAENTLWNADHVSPETTTVSINDDTIALPIPEYGLVQVRVSR